MVILYLGSTIFFFEIEIWDRKNYIFYRANKNSFFLSVVSLFHFCWLFSYTILLTKFESFVLKIIKGIQIILFLWLLVQKWGWSQILLMKSKDLMPENSETVSWRSKFVFWTTVQRRTRKKKKRKKKFDCCVNFIQDNWIAGLWISLIILLDVVYINGLLYIHIIHLNNENIKQ